MTKPLNVVVGVGGGIAAYKVAGLVRLFTEAGHSVRVVPTPAALNFVGTSTWEALSGNLVMTEIWKDVPEVPHVKIGQRADLVVVAPATADLIARTAAGMADDLLTNVILTTQAPIVFAPAMHTEMWFNPATQANVATLRERGITVVEPAEGRLTGKDSGKGRLPEVEDIFDIAIAQVNRPEPDLVGVKVLITAGGTREYIDPVRFIGNRSSGKQGVALALAARDRGAEVTLVAANVNVQIPSGVTVKKVDTTAEMAEAVFESARFSDVIVMSAAVADFTPVHKSNIKIKKSDEVDAPTINLTRTTDILAQLVSDRNAVNRKHVIVGFAAETGDEHHSVSEHGQQKLMRKGCDLLVVNEVGPHKGFETDTNTVEILNIDGTSPVHVANVSKREIADAILDQALVVRNQRHL